MAGTDNSEMSLAALKNFQELMFGRAQGSGDAKLKRNGLQQQEEVALPLPERLWLVSWRAWLRIAHAVTSPTVPDISLGTAELQSAATQFHKHFIPGTFHFTTLLSAFQPLFFRVGKRLDCSDVRGKGVVAIFTAIVNTPLSPEQGPFMINAQNAEINPSQECILDSVYVVFQVRTSLTRLTSGDLQEQLEPGSALSPTIPDLLRMLLQFVGYSTKPPVSGFLPEAGKDGQINWDQTNLINFAELSLRTCVTYFSKVCALPEVVEEQVFVELLKVSPDCLNLPSRLSASHWPSSTSVPRRAPGRLPPTRWCRRVESGCRSPASKVG